MELKQRNSESPFPPGRFLISLKWSTARDFDLAVVYENRKGGHEIEYSSMQCDHGADEFSGENEECMKITRLAEMKYLWIFCWDYREVQNGEVVRFKDSDLKLDLMDDCGGRFTVELDSHDLGNVCCLATIDHSKSGNARLINSSKMATLKGLKHLEQLLEIARDKKLQG